MRSSKYMPKPAASRQPAAKASAMSGRKVDSKPRTVDEYLATANAAQRRVLETMRRAIHAAAPGVEEYVGYGLAGFKLNGRPLLYLGAWAGHCALYAASPAMQTKFQKELKDFEVSKGTIKFTPEKSLPVALVKRLVKARIAENGRRKAARRSSLRTPKSGGKSRTSRSHTRTGVVMSENEIQSTRLLTHPRAKVFQAHADPAVLTQWWGPNGFTSTFHEFDFRKGGRCNFTFHGPDGNNYDNQWVFREVVPNERIDFDHVCPPIFRLIITLSDEAGKTRVHWHATFESAQVLAGIKPIIVPANEQNFDRLENVLAKI